MMALTLTCSPQRPFMWLPWESKSYSQQGFLSDKKTVRTKQNLVGSVSSLRAFISLQPITYYPLAFIDEKHIVLPLYGRLHLPHLELVYQYTMFKTEQSRRQQTVTMLINSKVCDMMVDSFILSKMLISAMFMSVTSKLYITHWATLLAKSDPICRTKVET